MEGVRRVMRNRFCITRKDWINSIKTQKTMRIRLISAVIALMFGVFGASAIDYFGVAGTVKDKVTGAGLK